MRRFRPITAALQAFGSTKRLSVIPLSRATVSLICHNDAAGSRSNRIASDAAAAVIASSDGAYGERLSCSSRREGGFGLT